MSRWRAVVEAEEQQQEEEGSTEAAHQQQQHRVPIVLDIGAAGGLTQPDRGRTTTAVAAGGAESQQHSSPFRPQHSGRNNGASSTFLSGQKSSTPTLAAPEVDPEEEVELPDLVQKKGKQKVNGEWKWLTGYTNPLVEEFYVFFNSTNRQYILVLDAAAVIVLMLDLGIRYYRLGWLERHPEIVPLVVYLRCALCICFVILVLLQVKFAIMPFHKSQHGGGFQTATIRRRDLASGLWSERIGFFSMILMGIAGLTHIYNLICYSEERAAGRTAPQSKRHCIDRMPDNVGMIQLGIVAVLRLRFKYAAPAVVWMGLTIFATTQAIQLSDEYEEPLGLKVAVMALITFAFVVVALLMEYFSRQRFEAAARLRQSAKRAEKHRTMFVQTMRQLFPRIDHLSQNKPVLEMSNNCLISCYQISDFPFWTTKTMPRRAVSTLERLFTLFDEWCMRLDVDKLTTIGDSYLAASNLRHSRELHTAADPLFELALVQQQRTARIARAMGMCFEGQVAIHAGRAAGVVLGTQTLRYEVFGEAVSTVTDIVLIAPPGGIVASAQARRCSSSLRSTFSPLPSRVSEEAEERFPFLELLLLEPRPIAPLPTQKQRYTSIFHQQRSPQATALQPSPQTEPLASPNSGKATPSVVHLSSPAPSPLAVGPSAVRAEGVEEVEPVAEGEGEGHEDPISSGGTGRQSMTSSSEDLRFRYIQQRLLAKRKSLAMSGPTPLSIMASDHSAAGVGPSVTYQTKSAAPPSEGEEVTKESNLDQGSSSHTTTHNTSNAAVSLSTTTSGTVPLLQAAGPAPAQTVANRILSPSTPAPTTHTAEGSQETNEHRNTTRSHQMAPLLPRAWQEEDFICDPRWFVPKSYSLSATEAVYRRFLLSQYMGPHAAVASFFCMFCALCLLIIPGNTTTSIAATVAVMAVLCVRLLLNCQQSQMQGEKSRKKWSSKTASQNKGTEHPTVLPDANQPIPMEQSVSALSSQLSDEENRRIVAAIMAGVTSQSSGRSSSGRLWSCWHRFVESAWRMYFTLQGLLCLPEIIFLLAACHLQNSSLLNGNTTYYAAALLAVVVLDTVGYPVLITIAFIAIDLMIGIVFITVRHGGSSFVVLSTVIIGAVLCVGVYSADLERRYHFEAVMLSQGKRGEMERELALHEALLEMLVPAPFIPAMIKKIEQSETEQIQVLQWLGEICVVTVRLDAFNSVSIDTENPAETLQAIERLYSFVEAALHVGGEVLSKIASFGDTLTIAGPISAKEGWKGSEYMFDSTTASDDDVIDEKLVPQFGRTLAAAAKPVQPLLQLAQGEELLMLAAEGVIKLISSLHESFGSTMTAVATCDSAFVAVLGASRPSVELLGNATRVTRAAVEAAPQGYVGITEKFHRLLETRVRSALTTLFAKPQTWRLRGPGSVVLQQWCPANGGGDWSYSSFSLELSQNTAARHAETSIDRTARNNPPTSQRDQESSAAVSSGQLTTGGAEADPNTGSGAIHTGAGSGTVDVVAKDAPVHANDLIVNSL